MILVNFTKWTGEGDGTPLQYSRLENPMDGGAWWAAVHGVVKSRTWLSDFTFTFLHWRRKWQPTPLLLPGESQGWRSLVGCVYGVAQSRTRLKQLSSSSNKRTNHHHQSVWEHLQTQHTHIYTQAHPVRSLICPLTDNHYSHPQLQATTNLLSLLYSYWTFCINKVF